MSPTAFKHQVSTLLALLTNCNNLIITIRQNRKLGQTTTALDKLQQTLQDASVNISASFNNYRTVLGSRFDLGDEPSLRGLHRCTRELQTEVESRLDEVAWKRDSGRTKGKEAPGFNELTTRWNGIERSIEGLLDGLARRIQVATPAPASTPAAPTPSPAVQRPERPKPKKQPNTDEVIISIHELDSLLDHLKNSWVEKFVSGKTVYVNVFDAENCVSRRPETGYVRDMSDKDRKRADKSRRLEELEREQQSERERKAEEKKAEERRREEEARAQFERELREVREREVRERERREAAAAAARRGQQQQQHVRRSHYGVSEDW